MLLPLQTLLLRLLPGFSLSLFFLKHTHTGENPTATLMPAEGGEKKKNPAKITCLLRNKGVVAHFNYCLQPQKGYFPVPMSQKRSIFNIYSLVRPNQSETQYLSLLYNYIGSCLNRKCHFCERPQGGGRAQELENRPVTEIRPCQGRSCYRSAGINKYCDEKPHFLSQLEMCFYQSVVSASPWQTQDESIFLLMVI